MSPSLATVHLSKPVRMLLIGAPGVGKGTQTSRLLARYPQISAISSGDLLRDNVRRGTELGIVTVLYFDAMRRDLQLESNSPG